MGIRGYRIDDFIMFNASPEMAEPAIINPGKRLIHPKLRDRVDQVAVDLVSIRIDKGDCFGTLAPNFIGFLGGRSACAKTRSVVYPFNRRLREDHCPIKFFHHGI